MPRSVPYRRRYPRRKYKSRRPRRFGVYRPVRSAELKCCDLRFTTQSIDSDTAKFINMNPLILGTDNFQRIGRKVMMKSIFINGRLIVDGTSDENDYIRIILIYDRQSNGAVPSIADVLTSTDENGATSSTSHDQLNIDNVGHRFKILRDYRFGWNATSSNAAVEGAKDYKNPMTFKFYQKLNLPAKYDAGNIIPNEGHLFLFIYGDEPAATNPFNVTLSGRLRYTDS